MAGDDDPEDDKEDENPHYDPFHEFGHFTEEELRNVMSDDTPDLMDFSIPQTPLPSLPQAIEINETKLPQEPSLSVSDFHISNEFLVSSLEDDFPFPWDMFESLPNDDLNNNINDNFFDVNIGDDNGNNVIGLNFETGGASTVPVTVTPEATEGILSCNCCNLLQQFVHSNGEGTRRLDVYGGIEFFCHAIVEIHEFETNELSHRTLHLKGLRIEDVKKFIDDYCSWKEECGFSLMSESNAYSSVNNQPLPPVVDVPVSLAMTNEALDVPVSLAMTNEALDVSVSLAMTNEALDVPVSLTMNNEALDVQVSLAMTNEALDVPVSLAMTNEALDVPYVPPNVGLREESKKKKVMERRQTPLAAQRERTGKLTLKDLSKLFHLPIKQAAREMNVCPTVVKRVCRKGGLLRWPYRKINSIEKKIAKLKSTAEEAEDAEKVGVLVEKETERLQKIISDLCSKALQNSQ